MRLAWSRGYRGLWNMRRQVEQGYCRLPQFHHIQLDRQPACPLLAGYSIPGIDTRISTLWIGDALAGAGGNERSGGSLALGNWLLDSPPKTVANGTQLAHGKL